MQQTLTIPRVERRALHAIYHSVVKSLLPLCASSVEDHHLLHTHHSPSNDCRAQGGRVTSSPTACRHKNFMTSSSSALRRADSTAFSVFFFSSSSMASAVFGSAFLSHRIWWHRPHFTCRWSHGSAKTSACAAAACFAAFFLRHLAIIRLFKARHMGRRALRGALDTLPLPVALFDRRFGAERILALCPHRRHGTIVLRAHHILHHCSLCCQIFSRLESHLGTSEPQLSRDFNRIQR